MFFKKVVELTALNAASQEQQPLRAWCIDLTAASAAKTHNNKPCGFCFSNWYPSRYLDAEIPGQLMPLVVQSNKASHCCLQFGMGLQDSIGGRPCWGPTPQLSGAETMETATLRPMRVYLLGNGNDDRPSALLKLRRVRARG